MEKDRPTRAFLIHLAIYALVVAICVGINLWLAPDNLWFIWVALGWGIGVTATAWLYCFAARIGASGCSSTARRGALPSIYLPMWR